MGNDSAGSPQPRLRCTLVPRCTLVRCGSRSGCGPAQRIRPCGERAGALIVQVSARAVDGGVTEAALTSVASAFGVRRSAVTLVAGTSSRTKIVEVAGGDPVVLRQLLAEPGR